MIPPPSNQESPFFQGVRAALHDRHKDAAAASAIVIAIITIIFI
jgi:hypothetical protein